MDVWVNEYVLVPSFERIFDPDVGWILEELQKAVVKCPSIECTLVPPVREIRNGPV